MTVFIKAMKSNTYQPSAAADMKTKNFEKNLKKIKDETGITIWLMGDVSRTFGLENAENNYKMFKEHPFAGFIGIGLGGAESKGP